VINIIQITEFDFAPGLGGRQELPPKQLISQFARKTNQLRSSHHLTSLQRVSGMQQKPAVTLKYPHQRSWTRGRRLYQNAANEGCDGSFRGEAQSAEQR
jgi:hypothetical protein